MGRLPKRIRQHVIEEESRQYVKQILPDEWVVQDVVKDYGIDLTVEIVIDEEVTGAPFSIQVKGTDKLVIRKRGYVAHRCKTSTLAYFLQRPEPVIYLVYDTQKKAGYWIWIKDYIRQELKPSWRDQETATVRIPLENRFNADALREIAKRVLKFHKPAKWLSAVESAQNPYFSYNLEVSDYDVRVNVRPKYPGAEKDRPIEMSGTFRFDMNDVEAQDAMRDLERHRKTGESVEIDARFFDGFGIPEALSDLVAHLEDFRPTKMGLGTAKTDKRIAVRISILDQDGSTLAEIPYIDYRVVQAGTEEITWSNEDQGIPLRVRRVINFKNQTSSISIEMELEGNNVVQIRDFLKIQQALARGKWFRSTFLSTGLSDQGEIPKGSIAEPKEGFVELIHDLAFIQEKTNQIIQWPGRITIAEMQLVRRVVNVLKTGQLIERIPGVHFEVGKPAARHWADRYASGEQVELRFDGQSNEIDLLGAKLSLGPATVILPNARPSEETSQRLRELDQFPDDTIVPIDLISEPGVFFYHQWLPQDSNDII